jgi:hypothetical protein
LIPTAGAPLALVHDIGSRILGSGMLTMLAAPGLTLLFLGVVVGLGTAFVWVLWEIEQMSKPHGHSDRFG